VRLIIRTLLMNFKVVLPRRLKGLDQWAELHL
jgi:hypothetical protein